jgi:hypothetical protein
VCRADYFDGDMVADLISSAKRWYGKCIYEPGRFKVTRESCEVQPGNCQSTGKRNAFFEFGMKRNESSTTELSTSIFHERCSRIVCHQNRRQVGKLMIVDC